MPDAVPAIVCDKLTKRYADGPRSSGLPGAVPGVPAAPGRLAVDQLDLTVARGEFFGLLGPNGAGKSTTIGMLTTRVIPTSGRAVVDGVDVVANPAQAKLQLASVSQSNTLDRLLTLEDNLYFHGRYFGMSRPACRSRSAELIERFELKDRAKDKVERLSGGLAQRVQIARALFHKPSVLFLDEPTAGLDPQTRVNLWDALRDLNRDGQTIILTTHYMEEADQLCRRLAIIDQGKLLASGSPLELKASVHAARLVTLSLTKPATSAVVDALRAVAGVIEVESKDRTIRVSAGAQPGLIPELVSRVGQAGAELRDLSVAEPSLEAVFLKFTGKEYRE